MDAMPRVSIIILNWNGWKDTIECLESVYQITYPNYDVIVVDNGSENDSIEKIKEYAEGKLEITSKFFDYSEENKPLCYIEYSLEEAESGGGREVEIANLPPWKKFILLKNGKNFGFAEGNNIAIRYTLEVQQPEYILLLNNDTIVHKSFLDKLVFQCAPDNTIGCAGPKSYYYDYYGRTDVINFAGGRVNMWRGIPLQIGVREIDVGQHETISNVGYIEGSCFLARKEVFEEIGLLDQSLFTYWEDADWCMRAKSAGYRMVYVPEAKIWHKVGASNNGNAHNYYSTRNRLIFMGRYADKVQLIFFLTYFFMFSFWYNICLGVIYHRNVDMCRSFIKGVKDGIIGF